MILSRFLQISVPGHWLATADPLRRAQSAKNLGCSWRKSSEWRFIVGKIMGKSAGKIPWEKYGKIIGNL